MSRMPTGHVRMGHHRGMIARITGCSCRRSLASHQHFFILARFLLYSDIQIGSIAQRRPVPDHRVRTGRRSCCRLGFALLLLQHPFPLHLSAFHFSSFLLFAFTFALAFPLPFPFLLLFTQLFFPLPFSLLFSLLSLPSLALPFTLFSLPLPFAFLCLSARRFGRYTGVLFDGRGPRSAASRGWCRRVTAHAPWYCTGKVSSPWIM